MRSLALAVVLAALCIVNARAAASNPTFDDLTGLWGLETSFGPQVRGELAIVRSAKSWTAQIAGFEVPVHVETRDIDFRLPGDQGSFRGRFDEGPKLIRGFWTQPVQRIAGQAYATPVTLRAIGAAAWRGTVLPLEERFSLYLRIERDTGGAPVAFFRNPEANRPGPLPLTLKLNGNTIALFRTPPKSSDDKPLIEATYDTEGRVAIPSGTLRTTLVLTRRSADQAVGFFPRTPQFGSVTYRQPLAGADGWQVARASAAGFDETALAKVVEGIADAKPAGGRAPLVHSLLIARHGKLVLDEYFYGFDAERLHDTRSGAKTFAGMLLGIAIDRGAPVTPGSHVYSLLSRYGTFANPDPRKARITVAHLLTHSTGLSCDDGDDDSPGSEDTMQSQDAQPNWYKYFLDLPVAHDPGTVYAYCSGGINLVGDVVRTATGMPLTDFFDHNVARPLQFGPYAMNLTPTGDAYLGGGMYLRPRDYLKLAQTYLDGGTWNGRRIVSASWVKLSTALQIKRDNATDGYAWHRNAIRSGNRTYDEYEANGNGGQIALVLPQLDVAIVFTGGNYGDYLSWRKFRDEIVPQEIIPAIR